MKKLIMALLIFVVIGSGVFALDLLSYPPPVEGGNIMIDAGVGLAAFGYSGAKWQIPPLFIQVEFALPKIPISVGGMFAMYKYGYKYTSYNWGWLEMLIAGRANWHWGFDVDWLDLYTGLSLGYHISKWDDDGYSGETYDYSGFYWNTQVGAHFYFSKNIGAIVEFGYPFWLKAGVAFKF